MNASLPLKIVLGILIIGFIATSQAQERGNRWRLRVMNLAHEVKVDATIRFASEAAPESCMAGTWKRVVVEATAVHEEAFFPLTQALAYQLEDGALTVGRTTVCDGYLFLEGKVEEAHILGKYNAVGLGTSKMLGSFTLDKVQ